MTEKYQGLQIAEWANMSSEQLDAVEKHNKEAHRKGHLEGKNEAFQTAHVAGAVGMAAKWGLGFALVQLIAAASWYGVLITPPAPAPPPTPAAPAGQWALSSVIDRGGYVWAVDVSPTVRCYRASTSKSSPHLEGDHPAGYPLGCVTFPAEDEAPQVPPTGFAVSLGEPSE